MPDRVGPGGPPGVSTTHSRIAFLPHWGVPFDLRTFVSPGSKHYCWILSHGVVSESRLEIHQALWPPQTPPTTETRAEV